ncbi:hypothetical protein [Winogradskyella sp. A3E31]|uniref:hypothetical protein n=1 Tax=Winogradskyella sp. A3E31 TaxID=3349637 RepID=UPI00398B8125
MIHWIKNKPFIVVLACVIFIQLILAFQGFDVCDDGFALTFYQQFFNDPSSVEYNFVYWLSGLFGGLWYQLFQGGGILWFKILALIVNSLTFSFAYLILKNYIKTSYLLIGLCMVLFANDFGFLVFYNNHLTALLSVLSVYFLHKGLVSNTARYVLFSGFIIGLNIFTRLPNLSQLALVLVIPTWYYIQSVSLKKSIRETGLFLAGSIVGILLVLALLIVLGQFGIMKNVLSTVFNLGTASDSGHNMNALLSGYFYNYLKVAKYTGALLGYLVLAVLVAIKFRRLVFIQMSIKIITAILFAIWIQKAAIHGIYGLGYIGIFGILLFEKNNKALKLLTVMAFVLQFLLPFGSGGGMKSSGYMAIWLSIPLFFYALYNAPKWISANTKFIHNSEFFKIEIRTIATLFGVIFLCYKAYKMSFNAYFDQGPRWEKNYTINSDLAKGIYTKERRAKIINDGLEHLKLFVEPNDYLLAYDKVPMLHFLTETRPYAYNSWPWIYDSDSFKDKLSEAENNIEELPVIIQQKFETIYKFSEPISDYMSLDRENDNFFNTSRTKVMLDFISRHNYKIVWSNDYFNIYKTEE